MSSDATLNQWDLQVGGLFWCSHNPIPSTKLASSGEVMLNVVCSAQVLLLLLLVFFSQLLLLLLLLSNSSEAADV